MRGELLPIILCVCELILFEIISVGSLRCYSCQDCEIYFNESLLVQCNEEDRCIKTVEEESGLVTRDCGQSSICTREGAGTTSEANSKERLQKLPRNRRASSSLLSPEQKTTTTKKPPPPQLSSLHCCNNEDGCNYASTISISSTLLPIIPIFIKRMFNQ